MVSVHHMNSDILYGLLNGHTRCIRGLMIQSGQVASGHNRVQIDTPGLG